MKILIVDDIIENLYLLESYLKDKNKLYQARNGKAALELLANNKIDLIISDILMPIMDGYQLCRECKKNDNLSRIPFIFYTATYTDEKDEEFALGLGADAFIVKPKEPDEFNELINSTLKKINEKSFNPGKPIYSDEDELILYNKRLISKLEKKILDLEKEYRDHEQTANQLKESEHKVRMIFENIRSAIFLSKVEEENHLRIIEANSRALALTGFKKEEIIGKYIEEILPPDSASYRIEKMLEAIKSKEPLIFEKEESLPSGKIFVETKIIPIINHSGVVTHILGINNDITEKIKNKNQLVLRAEQLNAINNLAKKILAERDFNLILNEIIEDLFKVLSPDVILLFLKENGNLNLSLLKSQDEMLTKDIFPIHKVGECLCGVAAASEKPVYSINLSNDKRCVWKECKKSGFTSFAALPLNGKEKLIGIIGFGSKDKRNFREDSTFLESVSKLIGTGLENSRLNSEIKKHTDDLENIVQERTKKLTDVNQELEAFAHSVAHDLKAPLRAINGFSNMLASEYSKNLDHEGNRMLKIICNNANYMNQLISDLLDLTRISRFEIKPILLNMDELLVDCLNEISNIYDREKYDIIVDELPDVYCDRKLIKIVLTNILDNAFKYTANQEFREIQIGGKSENDFNTYFIKDSGIGFDMKYKDKVTGIFERLIDSSTYEGSGVGLAIVDRIIKKCHGKLYFESHLNQGTTFYFKLPKGNIN